MSKTDWLDKQIIEGTGTHYAYRVLPGDIRVLELFHTQYPFPIGMVWFRFTYDKYIEILSSYVNFNHRRIGIRTRLNDQILRDEPELKGCVSQIGTAEGKAFMLAYGYRQTKDFWVFKRKKTKRTVCARTSK